MSMKSSVVIQNSKEGDGEVDSNVAIVIGAKMTMTTRVVIATPRSNNDKKKVYDDLSKTPKLTNPQTHKPTGKNSGTTTVRRGRAPIWWVARRQA